jgi:predicted GNAT family N-acyltransferase
MAYNTFKVVVPVILATADRLIGPVPIIEPPPKHFEGWTVQVDSRGYIRLFRKIRAQLHSVYLGRCWSESYARKRIASRALKNQAQEQITAASKPAAP